MIKVNELRIGNWVKPKVADWVKEEPKPYRIDLSVFYSMNHGGIREENLEPIPLTPEILEKAGFLKPAHTYCGDVFHLSEWGAYPGEWCVAMNKNNAVIVKKLKYLHQLQNLYFALTEEELNIEL